MRLRWPLWTDKCDDCGHTLLHLQKPWYTPRPVDDRWLSDYISEPIFSKDAIVLIGCNLNDGEMEMSSNTFWTDVGSPTTTAKAHT